MRLRTVTTSTYDAANRLLTEITPSGTSTFTFDADGNRTQQETPAGDLTTLTWDSQNRNIAVELPSLTIVTSVFNSDHNKVQRDDGTDVTNFLWDFKDLILETDDVGATLRRLTYKHAGPPNKRRDEMQERQQNSGIENPADSDKNISSERGTQG